MKRAELINLLAEAESKWTNGMKQSSMANWLLAQPSFAPLVERDPMVLPTAPGTVIAIGEWWLVRLPPYEGAPSAWELLPWSTDYMRRKAESMGIKAQCVYDDDWVLAEAEQEGRYEIVSEPVDAVPKDSSV